MSAPLPTLVPIKSVDPAARDDFAVSLALVPDGSPMVVSRFDDDVWDFYPYITQECVAASHKQIDWRARLPDGRRLTDSEHAALLNSAKAFIWSLFADPIEGRRRPAMLTLVTRSKTLLFLLRWMVDQRLPRFINLAGRTLAYAQSVARSLDGKPVSKTTLGHRLQVLEDIHWQRAKLDDALQVHPWPGESIASLSGFGRGSRNYVPTTEPIPDRVAVQLAQISIDYVRNRGPQILDARDAKDAALQQKREAGYGHDTLKCTRAAIVRQWGYENAYKLTIDLNRLRTACYIVIALFSGLRESEVMSLAENCIAHRLSRDGSCEVIWLHGTIYKTGERPKAWQVPSVVEEAVAILTRLTAPLRDGLRREVYELRAHIPTAIDSEKSRLVRQLTIGERHQDKLFLSTHARERKRISVLSAASVYNELRRFCTDHGIRGENGRAYPLHSHQFRRSYARFMACAELGDLLTLRDHFGHWSLDMTVYYADGASEEYVVDQELLDMVTAEKQTRQKEIVRDYLESDAPLANGEHWLGQWRARVRTAPSKEALIAECAGAITINGTGHSWCVGNARGMSCGGLCVFEPAMCVDCPYGIIGPEHRPVWEGIRDQQREALALHDMGASGQARAQRILEAALTVLRRLDGQEAQ
jgi:integrase